MYKRKNGALQYAVAMALVGVMQSSLAQDTPDSPAQDSVQDADAPAVTTETAPAVMPESAAESVDTPQPSENTPPPAATAPSVTPSARELHSTITGVLEALVEKGVLSREQADKVLTEAQQKAAAPKIVEEPAPVPGEKIIRVPYVPETVKNQIRDEIRSGLREDTVEAVLSQAKQERWGLPGVTPEWVDKIKIKGDVRLRAQTDRFADNNAPNIYFDFLAINRAGSFESAVEKAFLNVTEDRNRLRVRARLAVEAKITPPLQATLRITTGNTTDPVSTNQTLGNYGNRTPVVWDQAYLKYNYYNYDNFNAFTFLGGRFPNPFLATDLVWDNDLMFEGLSATYFFRMHSSDSLMDLSEQNRRLFFTLGAFPFKELELTGQDKWLFGAQLGTEWILESQSVFKLGLSYHSYENITGERNALDKKTLDYTAPDYLQKGNTLFNIRNNFDRSGSLYALAADYKLAGATATLDLASFAPHHVYITADYVENVGYDAAKTLARSGAEVEGKTIGYQLKVGFGWPHINIRGNWRVDLAYRYLERDAVVDAFADSDFHLGGTDAKGYILSGDYGLRDDTWLTTTLLSSDSIDGPPLGIDTFQMDINVRF